MKFKKEAIGQVMDACPKPTHMHMLVHVIQALQCSVFMYSLLQNIFFFFIAFVLTRWIV